MEGEKGSVLLSIREQIGEVKTVRNESQEALFSEMLTSI